MSVTRGLSVDEERVAVEEIQALQKRVHAAQRDVQRAQAALDKQSQNGSADIVERIELGRTRQHAKCILDELERELRARTEAYEADRPYEAPGKKQMAATVLPPGAMAQAVTEAAIERTIRTFESQLDQLRAALVRVQAGEHHGLRKPLAILREPIDTIEAQRKLGVGPVTIVNSNTRKRIPIGSIDEEVTPQVSHDITKRPRRAQGNSLPGAGVVAG